MRQRLSGFPLGCVAVCLALLAITSHGLAAPPLPPETVLLKKQLAYALEHSGKEREAAAVYRQLLARRCRPGSDRAFYVALNPSAPVP